MEMDEELRDLLTLFTPIKRFSSRLERGRVDLERPKTELARLTKALHGACEQLDGDRVARGLLRQLERLPPFDIKELLGTRPRPQGAVVERLCDYLEEADRRVPMLTSIVHGCSFLPTLGFLEHWMTAQVLVQGAAYGRGEKRAARLRALAEFLEVVYREAVTVLYEIECVRERRQIHRGLEFGNLVDVVATWTRDALPGFVDRDAARIRNAAAHYHWRYDPDTKLLHLHNRNKRGVTWEATFQLRELYRRLRDMYLAVGHLETALVWSMSTACFAMFREPPLSRMFEQGVLAAPPPELEEQNRAAIAARFTVLERHLVDACWTSRRTEHDVPSHAAQPQSAMQIIETE